MSASRGEIAVVAMRGDDGKPRPYLVVQSDLFPHTASVTFCPLTTDLRTDSPLLRLDITPTPVNGLRQKSQIAIDKISTIPKTRIGQKIGKADDDVMLRVTRALAVYLGIG
jgi:mRNA interferase MazF